MIRVDPVSGAQTVVSAIAWGDQTCGPAPPTGERLPDFTAVRDVGVCRPCPTGLSVPGGGSYGGTATLTATLDSGSPAWSTAGKRITLRWTG